MKKLIQFLALIIFITSCTSSKKNSLEIKDPDNALSTVVKTLNENPDNETARKELQIIYADIQRSHLSNIKSFKANNNDALPRWNDIILEYQALQNACRLIMNSPASLQILQPHNYANDIVETKEAAADHFYKEGLALLENSGRSNANKAYSYFKIADYYVPGYEEVKSKMNIAYQRAVINIVIDSLQDNSYFANSEWGQEGYDLSNEFFQKKLKTDLENASLNSEYPIAFYTKEQAQKSNLRVDWLISLNLIDLNISKEHTTSYTIPQISNQTLAENTIYGSDGFSRYDSYVSKSIYAQAPADNITLHPNFGGSAKVKISFSIKNMAKDKNLNFKTFSSKVQLNETDEYYNDGLAKTYFSDLSDPEELALAKALENIYTKMYPQIKDNVVIALK